MEGGNFLHLLLAIFAVIQDDHVNTLRGLKLVGYLHSQLRVIRTTQSDVIALVLKGVLRRVEENSNPTGFDLCEVTLRLLLWLIGMVIEQRWPQLALSELKEAVNSNPFLIDLASAMSLRGRQASSLKMGLLSKCMEPAAPVGLPTSTERMVVYVRLRVPLQPRPAGEGTCGDISLGDVCKTVTLWYVKQ